MELIESNKPGYFYYVDPSDYIYIKDAVKRTNKDDVLILYFRCLKPECKGRAIWKRNTPEGEILDFTVAHSHEPQNEKKMVLLFRSRLRKRASTEMNTPYRQIFMEEKELALKSGLDLGNYKSYTGMLKRARQTGSRGVSFATSISNLKSNLKPIRPRPLLEHSYNRAVDHQSVIDSDEDGAMVESIEKERDCHSPLVDMVLPTLIAPVFTPFNFDMTVNLCEVRKYANLLQENGISGVLVNSEMGEGFVLSMTQRKNLAESWVKAVESTNLQVMVHVGGASFNETIELIRHAKKIKAHGIFCLPDLYSRPKTCQDLVRFLRLLAYTAPKTPLLYDHNPALTDIKIDMMEFLQEVAGQIPNFAGIKFSSGNLDEGISALNANGGKFVVFWGSDQLITSALMGGFQAVIAPSLNIFPNLCTQIMEGVERSDFGECKRHQDVLNRICMAVSNHGDHIPGMKALMNMFTMIVVGRVREPYNHLKNKQIQDLGDEVKCILSPSEKLS